MRPDLRAAGRSGQQHAVSHTARSPATTDKDGFALQFVLGRSIAPGCHPRRTRRSSRCDVRWASGQANRTGPTASRPANSGPYERVQVCGLRCDRHALCSPALVASHRTSNRSDGTSGTPSLGLHRAPIPSPPSSGVDRRPDQIGGWCVAILKGARISGVGGRPLDLAARRQCGTCERRPVARPAGGQRRKRPVKLCSSSVTVG